MRKEKYYRWDLKLPDAINEHMKGKVKDVMITTYKAHLKSNEVIRGKIEIEITGHHYNSIITYSRNGYRMRMQTFGIYGNYDKTMDDQRRHLKELHYVKGELRSTYLYEHYESDGLKETKSTNGDGSLRYRTVDMFDVQGNQIERLQYFADDKLNSHVKWEYDKKGNMICCLQFHEGEILHYKGTKKYDDNGRLIEEKAEHLKDDKMIFRNWHKEKYNADGDIEETTYLNEDGSISEVYTPRYEYDKDGKRIIPPWAFDPDLLAAGETETREHDDTGNWIKKTTFYNKIPVNIIVREITYYDDPSENNPPLVHALADYVKEDVIEIVKNYDEDDEDIVDDVNMEVKNSNAQWLVDYNGAGSEDFPLQRYYASKYNETPSLLVFTGSYIVVQTVMNYLIENMNAKEIHSYSTIDDDRSEQMVNYTLSFERPGYILHTTAHAGMRANEFDLPSNIQDIEGYIYFGHVQLLRPSKASGKRDEYFEQELKEYVTLSSLTKKPDKPVINMIEVSGNSFSMEEHAINDDFEIKDLDLNYGYGFEKFHNDLMYRFNTSSKGLVLFHGLPGTGKTYYIRHLLRKMASNKKVVIYMPPNMVDHLVEPAFMTFLSSEIREWSEEGNFCVLLIEDAEPLLAKRQEGVRIQGITNLLNMTDGLLNDMLNLQIICTFNVDLKKLDSALLRPGRLLARKEFKALGELDANLLAQRLGIKHHFKKPATLGEIYALRKNQNTLIHDVESDRDASTAIDDL